MASYGGYGPDRSAIEDAMRSGTYFAPDNSPNPLGPGSNIDEPEESSSSFGSIGRILEALSKANAFKQQSAGSGMTRSIGSGGQGKFERINDTLSIYTPAPKVKQTGGSSGGPGFGDVGNIIGTAGTALGVFGPLGPLVAGGIGKAIDAFA